MRADEINRADVVEEISAVFLRYEQALLLNDIALLDAMFWDHSATVRYGVSEHSVGIAAVRAARAQLTPVPRQRQLQNTVIVTFGRDTAVVSTEFVSPGAEPIGRQTQTWVRMPEGWRIVAAHVSTVPRASLVRY